MLAVMAMSDVVPPASHAASSVALMEEEGEDTLVFRLESHVLPGL